MSALLDRVARRVGAPEGLTLHRTHAGPHQRAVGAWSWYATNENHREVLAGYVALRDLAKAPHLVASKNLNNGLWPITEVDLA